MKDPTLREKAIQEIKKDIHKYVNLIIRLYNKGLEKDDREMLIDLISYSKNQTGENFLKTNVSNKASEDRVFSFRKYMQDYKVDPAFIKGQLDDKQLRLYSLAYIVDRGKKEDYEVFQKIIFNANAPNEERILALKAAMLWASEIAKKEIYLFILQKGNEIVVAPSIMIFENIKSDEIREELFRYSKKGQSQITRSNACYALTYYETDQVIPYLIVGLSEEFLYEKLTGIDILTGLMSLGTSALAKGLPLLQTKAEFENRKIKIAETLKKLAKVDYGVSYQKWFDWAIYNGYTVNGVNLIHYLFSGYPEKRNLAIDSAIKSLGYKETKEYFDLYPNKTQTEIVLMIAEELLKTGIQQDEKY
ncbi:MAG TPA: hypothetical protein PLP72_01485 [Leptospiraceae bacterium]|nr:hypothetical protein [Leptospiraceae bacterium]HNE07205.1 hypothetical protein [Leptospiraceae bacterium]HNG98197.1 hypothetical protein [Leptospiraceae bacterium]HNI86718.1 hypothetical protein [Leptospiraceae bacterium]HNK54739.1 hypothetical protein [Leptospiraceae bacterium]